MRYLFSRQEIIDNINTSCPCLILQALTPRQSPAFIKQPCLTRTSINILASRPKGTGQALKRTFISADQKEGLGNRAQNTSPPSLHIPAHVPGAASLFPRWHLPSRLFLGKVWSLRLPRREDRVKKFNP